MPSLVAVSDAKDAQSSFFALPKTRSGYAALPCLSMHTPINLRGRHERSTHPPKAAFARAWFVSEAALLRSSHERS
jgi:hypothetical protein